MTGKLGYTCVVEVAQGNAKNEREAEMIARCMFPELATLSGKSDAAEEGECGAPPCPVCKRERERRSDYVRCRFCGLNWLAGENLSLHPHLGRRLRLVEASLAVPTSRSRKGA